MTHFYPEMGETAPATALITGRMSAARGGSKFYVKWDDTKNAAVLAAFTKHKLSAKNVERNISCIDGRVYWSALMTMKAYVKAQDAGIAASECLLD